MSSGNTSKIIDENHVYIVPKKEITEPSHLTKWLKSEAYREYIGFIECLNESVRGKNGTYPLKGCLDSVEIILKILNEISSWIDEIPPIEQPQRFGNKAFRTWYSKMISDSPALLQSKLPGKYHKSIEEIVVYFIEGFGNSTRIDYGTGHEMSFIIFLYCLFRIGFLNVNNTDEKIGTVIKIMVEYLKVVRKLQVTYRMEPAGSHGSWSLDDFQFVPFIWGSSQLIAHHKIEPSSFPDEKVINEYKDEYIFFGCLKYICEMKSGPFYEHSAQLWNISGTSSWTKINQGLIKMYKGEVLGKFPVIQHTYFGSLFSINEAILSTNPFVHPQQRTSTNSSLASSDAKLFQIPKGSSCSDTPKPT